jgi:hypothetical protein
MIPAMRRLGALTALPALCSALACAAVGCDSSSPTTPSGTVSLVLDIPNGALDPPDYSTVELVLHEPTRDVVRTASVSDGSFDLDSIDPSVSTRIEVTLRNDTGAAVGYGRTDRPVTIADTETVVIPVRRPIAYLAGTRQDTAVSPDHWTVAPATFSDLSTRTPLDGRTQVGNQAVLMIAAGPSLYTITQATSDPDGGLVGAARVVPISTADHQAGAALAGSMTGEVLDGAGSDDGSTLVIGTRDQLFAIDTASGMVRGLATGSFARVAILTTDTGELQALAIRNRSATGACSTAAELWWAQLSGTPSARMIAMGGFSDVATDRGRAFYVESCKNELGEATAAGLRAAPRKVATMGLLAALAVSNGQAYIGVQAPPATTSLLVAAIDRDAEPRTLWTEAAQQVVRATDLRGVQRQLDATSATFLHIEIGAGGDYLALTTKGDFHGDPVIDANFPEIAIGTEELRVFDAATGGVVQRYRSWCAGRIILPDFGDITRWSCASTTGQTAAAVSYGHHIRSMAFLYGKK